MKYTKKDVMQIAWHNYKISRESPFLFPVSMSAALKEAWDFVKFQNSEANDKEE